MEAEKRESPEYLRMSLAAAMTLGFKQGLFYRNARLYCINLLLTYNEGCSARCAYCGLSKNRPGQYTKKSFIRVTWPEYRLDEIIEAISTRQNRVKRICISMLTNGRAVMDTIEICKRLRSAFDIPVSLLISPTILKYEELEEFKAAGADKIGVAIDLATEGLFDRYRGNGVNGPHKWDRYWQCLADSLKIFGEGNAGSHFMTGMGETEREMCEAIQRVKDMGGNTHLFSFFPEVNSPMSDHPMPPMAQYRRIQVARYLIDKSMADISRFVFDDSGQIIEFGLSSTDMERLIETGEPFRTSGCTGYDGLVACNLPFANSRPGPDIRNFPFKPDDNDIVRIKQQMHLKT
jgi:biotin synthase